MILSGVARQVWSDIVDSSVNAYGCQALGQAMGDRFQLKGKAETYKAEFHRWRRKEDESFIEPGFALRRLVIRAYPKTAHKAREEMVLDRFLMGLDDEMRKHVSLHEWQGLTRS